MLRRLDRQTHRPSRVIVVDNHGDLPEIDTAGLGLDDIRVVRRPDNPGYAAAVNEARGAGLPRTLVLTHDAVFGDDLAADLHAALDEHPVAGAVGPVLHWGDDPSRVFSSGGRLTRGGRAWHLTDEPTATREVDWLDGAIVLYAADALDEIGWLDERYFLYFEDVDTSWRLAQAGRTTLIRPNREALQLPGDHTMYLGIRNMTLFAVRARIPLALHLVAVARRVAEEAVAAVLRGRPPHLLDAFRGWRDGRRGVTGHRPKARG